MCQLSSLLRNISRIASCWSPVRVRSHHPSSAAAGTGKPLPMSRSSLPKRCLLTNRWDTAEMWFGVGDLVQRHTSKLLLLLVQRVCWMPAMVYFCPSAVCTRPPFSNTRQLYRGSPAALKRNFVILAGSSLRCVQGSTSGIPGCALSLCLTKAPSAGL